MQCVDSCCGRMIARDAPRELDEPPLPSTAERIRGQQARRRKARQCAIERRRTMHMGATARCAAFVATIVWPWPRHCLGPLALAPCRCLRRANTLKFVDIFAGRNFGLVRGTIGALPRLGRQEVVRPGRTEGYTTWPGPTGRKTSFRTRPVDRPPRGARDRYVLGARHRARS